MGFVFFDLETSGLDQRFDQVLEVAAIRTDEDLKELDRLHVKCRLRPHVVPSIEALLVNGFDLDRCTNRSLPSHYEAMRDVSATFVRWSPSIFVGWNSLSFDEEFLRFAFYQSLTNSYPTSRHGNGRLDLMRTAGAAIAFAPESLTPVYTENGSVSLQLEALARANGVSGHRAHDAMSDTEAMIGLATRLRENARSVWSQSLRFAKKANAVAFLEQRDPFVATEVFQGRIDRYAVAPLGRDNEDKTKNRWIAADLSRDFDAVDGMSDDELVDWLTTAPRPLRSLKANASPMMMPLEELDEFGGADAEDIADRAETILSNAARSRRMVDILAAATQQTYENLEVEQQLYDDFCDDSVWDVIDQFHAVPWPERMDVVRRIPDRRYRQLGRRLVFEHAPDCLSRKDVASAKEWLKERLNSQKKETPWRTKAKALEEAQHFESISKDERSIDLIDAYRAYVSQLP